MILYPTRRAIVLAAAGAPLALLVAAAAPGLWVAAAGWILLTAALLVADAALAAPVGALALAIEAPGLMSVGRQAELRVEARFARAAPRELEIAVAFGERLGLGADPAGRRCATAPPRRASRCARCAVARQDCRASGPAGEAPSAWSGASATRRPSGSSS